MTRIIKLNASSKSAVLSEAEAILRAGGLVVFPSDTVYGLLVDAQNKNAVSKLLSFKDRPPGKAVSVFIPSFESLSEYAVLSDTNKQTLAQILPGAYTIALPSKQVLDTRLESEKKTLGVRLPKYEPVQSLVAQYGSPITATSANMAGRSPHYSIASLLNQLSDKKKNLIDLIVDAGTLPRNKPSTVVDLSGDTIETLRQGDEVFGQSRKYISNSPQETQHTGKEVVSQYASPDRPLVIIVTGDLGAGKTEMTRGIASVLGISDIISPTYVIYYEYEIMKHETRNTKQKIKKNTFIHVDLYNIQDPEEFEQLGLETFLDPGTIMVIEWGEKLGALYEKFKSKADVVRVKIDHVGETQRHIKVIR